MRKFIYLLLLPYISFAQTPLFKLSSGVEIPLLTIGINTAVTSAILKQDKPLVSLLELEQLDAQSINSFDRTATKNYSKNAQKWSDIIATGSLLLPLIVFTQEGARKEWGENSLIILETYLLNAGITNLTKEIVKRKRPFLYNPNVPLADKLHRDATSSFFSGHTSMTASSAMLAANLYNRYDPNNKVIVWSIGASIPLGVGYLRWKGGKHFWTDILVGYAVGSGISFLVPYLHERAR